MDQNTDGATDKKSDLLEQVSPDSSSEQTPLASTLEKKTVRGTIKFDKTPQKASSFSKTWALLATFVLVATSLFAFFLYKMNSAQKQEYTTRVVNKQEQVSFKAKVTYLEGDVWKLVDGRRMELMEDDVLSESDMIQTDGNGKMVLLFDEGSIIRLGPNTKVLLLQLKAESMSFQEEEGIVFARVEKSGKHTFKIIANDVTVTSLGTSFAVEVSDEVEVSVYESSVVVKEEDLEVQVNENEKWNGKDKEVEKIASKDIKKNEFISWSLEQDKSEEITPVQKQEQEKEKTQEQEQTAQESAQTKLYLSANVESTGIRFNWEVEGLDYSKGFKIVRNLTGSPSYPGDNMVYKNSSERSHFWGITDGKEWHFRICTYNGAGGCSYYSNEIVLKAPFVDSNTSTGSVNSITLTGSMGGGTANLNWSVDGFSGKGYKIVWSQNPGPTYPTRQGDTFRYLSDPNSLSINVGGLEAGKTYYFRVCEYLSGKCGVYSNEISLSY